MPEHLRILRIAAGTAVSWDNGRISGDGTRRFSYSEHIEIFENWIEGSVEIISGVPVVSADGLIRMKRKLGREKDFADIALIEKARDARRIPFLPVTRRVISDITTGKNVNATPKIR